MELVPFFVAISFVTLTIIIVKALAPEELTITEALIVWAITVGGVAFFRWVILKANDGVWPGDEP
jgi:hypothetical protein